MSRHKGVYAVLTHRYRRKSKNSQWEVFEQCEFVDKLKVSHKQAATLILEVTKGSIVKERGTKSTYTEYMSYLAGKYSDELTALSKVYNVEGLSIGEDTEETGEDGDS